MTTFWPSRFRTNAETAIFHQWTQLETSGCIENFRLAAGEKTGFRQGWFFADSDAHKWLDAAARIYANWPLEGGDLRARLKTLMDDFIALLGRAQQPDGYLYTYNQLHFPASRWENLMIEHELYCHGHLIEAGVSHHAATGEDTALAIARKAADLLVRTFRDGSPDQTDGHEEIEIALLRLYETTGEKAYLELAGIFLSRRGRARPFIRLIQAQNVRVAKRGQFIKQSRLEYQAAHPEYKPFQLPPGNPAKTPKSAHWRWMWSALTGQYFQMHAPIEKQTVPVGHAVRFAYLETAVAMLARFTGDRSRLPVLEKAWERMVTRRMYVTGGIGSLPEMEGFGRDDELDPEVAYAETCAALGSVFWNREMARLTHDARYDDLLEWQLYNAALVGMGLAGDAYFYNNPLLCRGGVTRGAWFAVPCCPSNLSRTLALLDQYTFSCEGDQLWAHQYLNGRAAPAPGVTLHVESGLPWDGIVCVRIESAPEGELTLDLRIPGWAAAPALHLNGQPVELAQPSVHPATAGGYDPRLGRFVPLRREWRVGDEIELSLDMPITLRRAAPRVRGHRGKVAVTRGPLVYCLESVDNPGVDLFSARLDLSSLSAVYDETRLGGTMVISGETVEGRPLTFIPYCLWGNRGPSQMTVWVQESKRANKQIGK